MTFAPEKIAVGDVLPELALPPVNRAMLALFAGASGDHHPIHIDLDYARAAGMPDVFAHGMLVMAWLGRHILTWAPQERLRALNARFVAITHLGDRIVCQGTVVAIIDQTGERMARVEMGAFDQHGERKVAGEALISLSPLGKDAD